MTQQIDPMSPVTQLGKLTYSNTCDLPFDKFKLCLATTYFTFVKDGVTHEGLLYIQYDDADSGCSPEEAHWRLLTRSTSQNMCAWGCRTHQDCIAMIRKFFAGVQICRTARFTHQWLGMPEKV